MDIKTIRRTTWYRNAGQQGHLYFEYEHKEVSLSWLSFGYDSLDYNNRITSSSTHNIKSEITLYTKWNLLGDTNRDGIVSIGDVTAIQRHLAELAVFNDEQLAVADTNGDGEINISDATHLQMYLAEYDGVVLGKQ